METAITIPFPLKTLHRSSDSFLILKATEKGLRRIHLPGTVIDSTLLSPPDEGTLLHSILSSAADQIHQYLAGERLIFDIAIDPAGTPFQQRVWALLRAVPYGSTRSYGRLAQDLGNRNKSRAVGNAANKNPLPLIIPCHRLIGTNGSLTGFAGGLELKQALLDHEKHEIHRRQTEKPFEMNRFNR